MYFDVGAIGISIANPTDLVKVRLQAEGKLPPGVPKRYYGSMDAYVTIVKQVKDTLLKTLVYAFPSHCALFASPGGASGALDWGWSQHSKKRSHQCCRAGQL